MNNMIELYDNPVSTSAQKVRLVLAEKGIFFKSHILNLQAGDQFDPEFLKINPSAHVPALLHDDHVLTETNVICEYLDDAFPEPPLRPKSAYDRAVMRGWTEQTISWCIVMINNINVGIVFAPMVKSHKTPEEVEEQINAVPNSTQRERQHSLYDQGASSPLVARGIKRYYNLIGEIDAAVQQHGPWLAGDSFSLADTGIFPYVNRLHDLQWDRLWQGRSAYLDWYERVKARPSFEQVIGEVVPQSAIEFAQKCSNDAMPRLQKVFDSL